MTTKVCPPDGRCQQLEVAGSRYRVQRDGKFHMADAHAPLAIKGGECFAPAMSTRTVGATWRCVCGWEATINHCPKCDKSDLTKEIRNV